MQGALGTTLDLNFLTCGGVTWAHSRGAWSYTMPSSEGSEKMECWLSAVAVTDNCTLSGLKQHTLTILQG